MASSTDPFSLDAAHVSVRGIALAACVQLATGAAYAQAQLPVAAPAASVPQTLVVPPALQGTWMPLSHVLEPLKPLTLFAHTLDWSICRGAAVRPVAGVAPAASGVTLALQDAGCELDGQALTHLRLVLRNDGCDAELSLFTSPESLLRDERQAWGVVTLPTCKKPIGPR